MAFNITRINAGNRMALQALKGYYYAPKRELDLVKDIPNFKDKNLAQLKALINTDFAKFGNDEGENLSYVENEGQTFFFRDGKSDVYTKGGLDFEVFDYLDRQMGEKQKWRLETNNTQVDFKAGGKIVVGGEEFVIVKVLTILSSGTNKQKYLGMGTPNNFSRYAPKMLAVI